MSVETHRHCQATVLAARGVDGQTGATWNQIDGLDLSNLNGDWKGYFNENTNITQDIAGVLHLINDTKGYCKTEVARIDGAMGNQMNTANIYCYIAPDYEWFHANSVQDESNDYSSKMFREYSDTLDSDRKYFKINDQYKDKNFLAKFFYETNTKEKRIYPGDDKNFSKMNDAENDNGKKKYPLFTLGRAVQYLQQFRSNGTINYYIITQYGFYDYGAENTNQIVRLADANSGSTLYIGPEMGILDKRNLPAYAKACNWYNTRNEHDLPSYYLTDSFQDDDLVKVKFSWSDNRTDRENWYSGWVYGVSFQDSTVAIRGCGFEVRRERHTNNPELKAQYTNEQEFLKYCYNYVNCPSFLALCVNSGNVSFRGCLFRNGYVVTNSAGAPRILFEEDKLWRNFPTRNSLCKRVSLSPNNGKWKGTLQDKPDPTPDERGTYQDIDECEYLANSANRTKEEAESEARILRHSDFNLDRIDEWVLPSIFVDDEPPSIDGYTIGNEITAHQITLTEGHSGTLRFSYPYLIFKNRRGSRAGSPISISATDSMAVPIAYDHLSKILFFNAHPNMGGDNSATTADESNDGKYSMGDCLIGNNNQTSITCTTGSIPSDTNNKKRPQMFRIEIWSNNNKYKPSLASDIFQNSTAEIGDTNTWNDYIPEKGIYNSFGKIINESYQLGTSGSENPWDQKMSMVCLNGQPLPSKQ